MQGFSVSDSGGRERATVDSVLRFAWANDLARNLGQAAIMSALGLLVGAAIVAFGAGAGVAGEVGGGGEVGSAGADGGAVG